MISPDGSKMLDAACEGIYVERGMPEKERDWLLAKHAHAFQRLGGFFGEVRGHMPRMLFCSSDDCRIALTGPTRRSMFMTAGGRAQGATFVCDENTIIVDWIDRYTEDTLLHEMTHAELNFRLGRGSVPSWFHEGVATYVSRSPECADVPQASVNDLRALTRGSEWRESTNNLDQQVPIYCRARSELELWLQRNGKDGLFALIQAVAAGKGFETAYGPLLTQD